MTPLLLAAILATPIESIQVVDQSPVIPRGGILMVHLMSEEEPSQWPIRMPLTLEDGRAVEGHVAWIVHWNEPRIWTAPRTRIQTSAPEGGRQGSPVLLARLPVDATGPIRVGASVLQPRWAALPAALPRLDLDTLPPTAHLVPNGDDDEPPMEPLEWWRWTLIAHEMGVLPPKVTWPTEVDRLAAEHGAQQWRLAMTRLAVASRGVAATCRDLLTATCLDDGHPLACWVADADALGALLELLLDDTIARDRMVTEALSWCDERDLPIAWLEQPQGQQVRLAVANHSSDAVVLQWRWPAGEPLAVELPPGVVTRMLLPMPSILPAQIALEPYLQVGGRRVRLTYPRAAAATIEALPPALWLGMVPPWFVDWVRSDNWVFDSRPRMDYRRSTYANAAASLQHVQGRWELLVSWWSPGDGPPLPITIDALDDLRGTEALTLVLARDAAPVDADTALAVISMSRDGSWRRYRGEDVDLVIHAGVQHNQPLTRAVLPESWFGDGVVALAVMRTYAGSDRVETAMTPCLPWRIELAPMLIDLAAWDRIDEIPVTAP